MTFEQVVILLGLLGGAIFGTFQITWTISHSDKDKKILQGAAETCPVGKSLHPDIRQAVTWHYGSAK